jgi:hypothetical protein
MMCALTLATTARADSSVKDTSAQAATPRDAGCERLGPKWKLAEIVEAAVHDKSLSAQVQTARVLAWEITKDDRPLIVERALVWLAFKNKRWTLTHLYHHPQDGPKADWHVAMVYDVPYVGSDSYGAPPTKAQLDDFLKQTWWHFKPESDWKLVDSEVCAEAWKTAFNAPPWHKYEK